MTIVDDTHDAFGRALVDHLDDRDGPELVLECDDGSSWTADMQPRDFFAPPEAWPSWERDALANAAGSVLDLGAGGGRHSLYLQARGHAVTAVDASPGAAAAMSTRGVVDVRIADLRDVPMDGAWKTILLMGGNLGIAGDWAPTRSLLERLANGTSPGAILIGDSVDPTSDAPNDLDYQARNRMAGFHRGHIRLRLRYRDSVTPWWDQLNVPLEDLEALIDRTGWVLEDRLGDADGYAVVLRHIE